MRTWLLDYMDLNHWTKFLCDCKRFLNLISIVFAFVLHLFETNASNMLSCLTLKPMLYTFYTERTKRNKEKTKRICFFLTNQKKIEQTNKRRRRRKEDVRCCLFIFGLFVLFFGLIESSQVKSYKRKAQLTNRTSRGGIKKSNLASNALKLVLQASWKGAKLTPKTKQKMFCMFAINSNNNCIQNMDIR